MLLIRLFVARFYQANAGFFLFFFFLFFGSVSGGMLVSYHLSLINSIIGSAVVHALVTLLWVLYALKCPRFSLTVIRMREGSFLFELQAWTNFRQALLFTLIQLLQLMPVLLYAVLVSVIALHQQQWHTALITLLGQVLLVLVPALLLCRVLNSSWRVPVKLRWFEGRNGARVQPFPLLFLNYLRHRQWRSMIAIKTFCFLLIYLMFLNGKDTGREYLVLVWLVCLLAHTQVPLQLVAFLERQCHFHRNLPLPTARVALLFLCTYSLLLLPELLYLLIRSHTIFPLTEILGLYSCGLLSLWLLTAVQYTQGMNHREYTKVIFGLFFISVFGFYNGSYALLAVAQAMISAVLFWNGYPGYERN